MALPCHRPQAYKFGEFAGSYKDLTVSEAIEAKGDGKWSSGAAFVSWVGGGSFKFVLPDQLALLGDLMSLEGVSECKKRV